ncbi:MAG: DUF2029 domain-containing protein [Taibaiella sp.]|nr:DUF2029 domain-containing protein [Taibaiella sp.]
MRKFFLKRHIVFCCYVIVALGASLQLYLLSPNVAIAPPYTLYNNYVIFRQSFYHLIAGHNLYIFYDTEHWDLYKYSPTFALLMGLLVKLPDIVQLTIWNTANALLLYVAIRQLPYSNRTLSVLLWFVLLELLTSMQNSQSNALMAGLMIGTYCMFEKGMIKAAAFLVVMAALIKIYGAVVFCLFLFYPGKRRFIAWCVILATGMAALPLLVTPLHTLLWQYHNWAQMMIADEASCMGISVMGWLHTWFGAGESVRPFVNIVGIAMFLLPFTRWRLYKKDAYKLLMLAHMLVWVVIFNHKAESATYVIVMVGIGIWYFLRKRGRGCKVLLWTVFIFTSLSSTDIFPPYIHEHIFIPYVIKAVPCILAWVVIMAEILTIKEATLNLASYKLHGEL